MSKLPNAYLILNTGPVKGYSEGDQIPLTTDLIILGRRPGDCSTDADLPDIEIADMRVSRGHVRIFYSNENNSFMLLEPANGSKNGTFVGVERISPGEPYPLAGGDTIRVSLVGGQYIVEFTFWVGDETIGASLVSEPRPTTGLMIDAEARIVWLHSNEVHLRHKEFDLLSFLYHNTGRACTRDEIAQAVWPEDPGGVYDQTIDAYVSRIRQVIHRDETEYPRITTVHRRYRLDLEEPAP